MAQNNLRSGSFRRRSIQDQNQQVISKPMEYQALKLCKIMGQRHVGHRHFKALDKASGLQPIHPDQNFDNSMLAKLAQLSSGNQGCQILIVVAMYNQGVQHFKNTMEGIASNLKTFNQWGVSPEKIGVCVIVDGITPFYKTAKKPNDLSAQTYFSQFYDEEKIIQKFNLREKAQNQHDENRKAQTLDVRNLRIDNQEEHDEIAHVFMQSVDFFNNGLPLQTFFCIKQKNLRKLNTHLWFLGGFCQQIKPKYVYFLDIGTKPQKNSLFYLYQAMVVDPQIAGCCGQIKPMNASMWNFVTISQQVEYKFAHIFDKALQSVLGYITVLPGAFSAYRWQALQGDPLWKDYFRSICHPEEMGPFEANIYLAEDRVLCLSLLTKENEQYLLRYVRESIAQTDVPQTISELMSQRRRWINGSWFALIDSLRNINKVRNSSHSLCRKIIFIMQFIYYYITVIFTWFLVSTFFLSFAIAVRTQFDYTDTDATDSGNYIVMVYVALLLIIFVFSMGVHPMRVNTIYRAISYIFGIYMIFILFLMFTLLLDGQKVAVHSRVAVGATFLLFVLVIISNCCVSVIMKGVFQYLGMVPTFVNIFCIYAVCNIHDCSWGNRPDQMTSEERDRLEEFKEFRTKWTLVWVICNVTFGYVLNTYDKEDSQSYLYLGVLSIFAGVILVLRGMFGLVYIMIQKCKPKMKMEKVIPGQRYESDNLQELNEISVNHLNGIDPFNISPEPSIVKSEKNESDQSLEFQQYSLEENFEKIIRRQVTTTKHLAEKTNIPQDSLQRFLTNPFELTLDQRAALSREVNRLSEL